MVSELNEMGQHMHTIEVDRNGAYLKLSPQDLTNDELYEALSRIVIDSDEFISDCEIQEGYAAINEAVNRLQKYEAENDELKKQVEKMSDDLKEELI